MSKLKSYKKIYWEIKLPDEKVQQNWQDLKAKINPPIKIPFFRFGFIASIFLLFSSVGIIGLAQAASPGAILYPVKVLSDKVFAKVSGQPQLPTEKRVEELIDVSKKQPAKLEEVTKEYRKALNETEKAAQGSESDKSKLRKSLDQQQQQLKEAIKENPKSERKLEEVLKNTQDAKEKLGKDKRGKEGDKKKRNS